MDEWLFEYQRDQENCIEEESESGSDILEEEGDCYIQQLCKCYV